MKVLQIAPYFLPYFGGQEKYVYNLSRYLVNRGHEVTIFTSNYPKCEENESLEGINIERCRCMGRPLRNPLTPGIICKLKRIKDFDVIHMHNEHSFMAMYASINRMFCDVPLILTCHGQLKFDNPYIDRFEKVYSKHIGKRIFELADQVCVLSPTDKNYILSLNNSLMNISILSNAIDHNYLESLKIDKLKIINKSEFRILYVGKLIERKGIRWLIKAMNIIVNKYNIINVMLTLVGNGDGEYIYKSLAHEYNLDCYIEFIGEISDKELSMVYQSSNIFVLPSLSEGCPTVILEAMFFGLPVISTDIPAVRDLFKDFILIVPPKNEFDLAETMIKLMHDEQLMLGLSKEGEELVKSHYIWDILGKKYEKLYENLCKND